MAVTTVAITGHVLGPSGVAPTSGKVTIRLSVHGSTLDGAESVRVAGEHSVTLGAGGALSVSLVPNDAIVPSGTYYVVEFVLRLPNGRSWLKAERWQLTSDDLTIDLGSVPRLDVVPGIAVATESAVSASVLASATASASSASASASAAAASEGAAEAAQTAAEAARDSALTKSWYVDSINGSNANSGRSPSAALQTIAALIAKGISAGETINLARGSHWREQLSGLPERVTVQAYGEGSARPLLDCSDIALNANFSKTGGRTNVYEIAWTNAMGAGTLSLAVYEDDVLLHPVASQALCDSTPGSFYYASVTSGGTTTVYVHATGSTNPISNGKRYELPKRSWGVSGAVGGSIIGIHGRRNGDSLGSILSLNYAKDCLAEDGIIHNFFVLGVAEDCIAWKCAPTAAANGATMFISYDANGGDGVLYRRCRAIGPTDWFGMWAPMGYFSHTSGPKHERVVYEDCEAHRCFTGIGAIDFTTMVVRNIRTTLCVNGMSANPGGTGTVYVLGGTINGWQPDAVPYSTGAIVLSTAGTLYVQGLRMVFRTAQGGLIWSPGGTTTITRCTLVFADNYLFQQNAIRQDTGTLNVSKCIVYNAIQFLNTAAGVTVASNSNVLYPSTMDCTYLGTYYADVAAYKAGSGQDAASVTTDPAFNGSTRNGNFNVGGTSPALALTAGADIGPTTDDLTLEGLHLHGVAVA